ncbi:MAG: hypothetical protein EOQ64_18910 [Mesorhizobium sp.]|uniref:hypothetical protein n=1 Tax=Mesorhizobium sp. TaxID=1871066 RepID=UPI000FE597F0|nr:hypothetical protein [Mesorhizobium sp.]RWG54855.1 MAG: hypothetical protein EOQ64_18910 [Mesorhizobium sp.]
MANLGVNVTVGPRSGRLGHFTLESVTRPSAGERVLQAALAKVPPVDNSGDADFSFGGPSRFTVTQPEQRTNPSVTYEFPPEDDKKDDEPKDIHIVEYDEYCRSSETNRIENPDDPEQYVMDKNTLRVIFIGRDDGRYIALNFKTAKELSK